MTPQKNPQPDVNLAAGSLGQKCEVPKEACAVAFAAFNLETRGFPLHGDLPPSDLPSLEAEQSSAVALTSWILKTCEDLESLKQPAAAAAAATAAAAE